MSVRYDHHQCDWLGGSGRLVSAPDFPRVLVGGKEVDHAHFVMRIVPVANLAALDIQVPEILAGLDVHAVRQPGAELLPPAELLHRALLLDLVSSLHSDSLLLLGRKTTVGHYDRS